MTFIPRALSRQTLWIVRSSAVAVVVACAAASLPAQDDTAGRLIDQPPFDRVTLDVVNENREFKISPLADRHAAEKHKPSDKLLVKLLDTGEEYSIEWFHIAKLE